jgi:hypothetical protein
MGRRLSGGLEGIMPNFINLPGAMTLAGSPNPRNDRLHYVVNALAKSLVFAVDG